MLPTVGLVAALLVAVPASDASVRAYVAAWRGDLAEARGHADAALAKDPGDGAALFVAACVEIEEGHYDAAGALATQLASLRQRPPEAEIVGALGERRRASPSERMEDALAGAWKAAGRPDLGKAGLLKQLVESVPKSMRRFPRVESGAKEKPSPGDAFLLAPLDSPAGQEVERQNSLEKWSRIFEAQQEWGEARAAEALALARAPGSNSVELNVFLLRWLKDRGAQQGVLKALDGAMPENGMPAFTLVMYGTADEAPLTALELDTIERAAERPEFAWPIRALQAELVKRLRAIDPLHAELLALSLLSWNLPVPLAPITLAHRAEATKEPTLRARAAIVTEVVGKRLRERGTLIDVMVGYIARNGAARLRSDPRREALSEGAEAWRTRLTTASDASAVYSWPLPTRWRQWDLENEVQFLTRLADAPPPP